MNKFIIVYDLIGENKNYDDLIKRLETYPTCLKLNKSAYAIKTNHDHKLVRDELCKLLDEDDSIMVAEITGCAASHNIECGTDAFKEEF